MSVIHALLFYTRASAGSGRLGPLGLAFTLVTSLSLPVAAGPLDQVRGLVGTTWYSVSILGQRAGYAYVAVEMIQADGTDVGVRVTQFMHGQVQLQGFPTVLTLETRLVLTYNDQLRLVRLVQTSNELGRLREVEAEIGESTIEAVVRAAGIEERKSIPLTPLFGSDLPLTLAIAQGEAKVGDSVEFDAFDPNLVDLDRQTATITGRKTLEDGRDAYVLRLTTTRIPLTTESVVAPAGTLVSMSISEPLPIVLERVPEESVMEGMGPLTLSGSITTNVQIAEPKRLSRMTLIITERGKALTDIIPATRRQRVETQEGATVVTVTRLPFEGPSATIPIQGEEFEPYLRPSERNQTDDPLIVAKAREIVGEERDARKAAALIVHWVYANLQKIRSEPRPISAREVLEQMGGDCSEHATLCAALAAAVGIPAKLVSGIVYMQGAFYYHAWNELYVGEWVEVDPSWDELSVNAGHVQLAASSLDTADAMRAIMTAGRSIGALGIEIRDFELQ